MSDAATVIYKCRACGGEVLSGELLDGHAAMRQLLGVPLDRFDPAEDIPATVEHECPGGRRLGIAAVVGVQFDQPRAES